MKIQLPVDIQSAVQQNTREGTIRLRLIASLSRLQHMQYGQGYVFYHVFYVFYHWLNSQISQTRVDQHLKLGEMLEFGDTQKIGIVKFM